MGNLRLHPKHGVNPTIPVCFFCGKDRNEVALLGAAYKGEAPMHMMIDYEPCDTCKGQMASGITMLEADNEPPQPNMPEFKPGVWLTGRWCVITVEAIGRIITSPQLAADIVRARRSLVEKEVFEKMIGGMPVNHPEGSA